MAEVENVPCPLCANTTGFLDVRVSDRDDYIRNYGALYAGMAKSQWKICGRCGFVHQNPRPSIEALDRFYLGGSYHEKVAVPAKKIWRQHAPSYVDEIDYAIAKSGLASGTVLDIGCGFGVALALFKKRGWECYGIEPDSGRAEFARDAWDLPNVTQGHMHAGFTLPAKVDLVFTHHAFEHFADLHGVMRGIQNVLRPGGFMFTSIPTFRANRSSMSKLWMNSAHYSLFTDRSFGQLLARHGFEEVAHAYHGWRAGPDQLGHVARFTGTPIAPEPFYEDAREVARYLDVVNPLRSAVWFPLRGGYYGYRHHLKAAMMRAVRAAASLRPR